MNSPKLEALQLRIEKTVARWNTSLRRFYVFDVLLDTIDAFNADQMSLLAGSLSYYALLALFPLLLVLVSLASFFVSESAALSTVMDYAREYLPGVENEVQSILHQVIETRGTATLFGLIVLMWSASGVFDVLQQALNRAWRVPQPRAFWLQRLYSIGVIGVLGLVFLSSLLASALSTDFAESLIGDSEAASAWLQELGTFLGIFFGFSAFAFLYRLFPHARVPWRAAVVSAAIAALLWQIAKGGYIFYINYFARYNLVYGSLGAIIGLLFWGYLTAMIVLLGAELSVRLGRTKDEWLQARLSP